MQLIVATTAPAGIFDHAMVRFKPSALEQEGRVGALFRRADGTLAHYFSLGTCCSEGYSVPRADVCMTLCTCLWCR